MAKPLTTEPAPPTAAKTDNVTPAGKAASSKPAPSADVDAQLAALLKDAKVSATADAALRKVGRLELRTDEQKAEATWVRAQAYLSKEDTKNACKELNDVVNAFPGSKHVVEAKSIIEAGC
jgi:outer membrane PBP1 activator LpoA protein